MSFDAVSIAVIAGVVAVLLLATALSRRGGVDEPGARGPYSSSTESQAGLAALGATNPAARPDPDRRAGDRDRNGDASDDSV